EETNSSLFMDTPSRRLGRDLPAWSQAGNGRIERREVGPTQGTAGAQEFPPGPNPLHKLGNLLHLSLCVAGDCDRTLRPFSVGGPFPCPAAFLLQSCPAFDCSTGR